MMRVGFDISQLAHQGGVGVYTQNLAEQLSKLADLEMVYFYSSLRKPYKGKLKNVKSYRLPPTLFEMLFNRWRNVSIEKFLGPLDVFHSSDWTEPPSKAKKVTTVHDLSPLKFPRWSHPKIVSVHKRKLKLIEEETDCVIAVSESTKRDLLEISKIPESKITVIYEGASFSDNDVFSEDARFAGEALEPKIRGFKEKYNLPQNFILAIGGVGERKNLKRIEQSCKDYNLVILGQTLPRLSMEELKLLYSSASVLVYASLYEGFGLPILDSFASGLPVITSNVSSMPEIGGEAALYADPLSVEDIKEKIDSVLGDKNLREELIEKGFKRVKQFSWEKCAEETAKVYRRIMK